VVVLVLVAVVRYYQLLYSFTAAAVAAIDAVVILNFEEEAISH